MKYVPSALIVVAALSFAAGPAFAQSAPQGNGAVAGEGPGGSGAGQSSGGPGRSGKPIRAHMMKHAKRHHRR